MRLTRFRGVNAKWVNPRRKSTVAGVALFPGAWIETSSLARIWIMVSIKQFRDFGIEMVSEESVDQLDDARLRFNLLAD
ncbi:hypothetical protein [uncultured Roseovarius sp.]|jgi:hypothetical protein|uniref:hypothetical protein n=1 Tax=uncultured Roseovarius sp. TaxID=293344 RepID=UPI0026327979|nr:hypothetical protein [uncultured Roseovarius sp.]